MRELLIIKGHKFEVWEFDGCVYVEDLQTEEIIGYDLREWAHDKAVGKAIGQFIYWNYEGV